MFAQERYLRAPLGPACAIRFVCAIRCASCFVRYLLKLKWKKIKEKKNSTKCLSELFCLVFVEIILRLLRLQSKGINFYDATLQGYNEDKDGSYDVSYMKLKDMYEDLLLPEGPNYH